MRIDLLKYIKHGMLNIDLLILDLESIDQDKTKLSLNTKHKDNVSPLSAMVIVAAMKAIAIHAKQITQLDLAHNHLYQLKLSEFIAIMKAISPSVKKLDISWNMLCHFGVAGLQEIIQAIPKTVNDLGLRGNNLGKFGRDGLLAFNQKIPTHVARIDVKQNLFEQLTTQEWKEVYAVFDAGHIGFDIEENGVDENPLAQPSKQGIFAVRTDNNLSEKSDNLSKSDDESFNLLTSSSSGKLGLFSSQEDEASSLVVNYDASGSDSEADMNSLADDLGIPVPTFKRYG